MSLFPQFDGKPDPWPGLVGIANDIPALPNDELKALYVERYGQAPGNPSADDLQRPVPGFYDESFDANYWALKAAMAAGEFGPENVGREPTYTEQVDCAMSTIKASPFYRKWWWETREGGLPTHPAHVNDASRPHGPFVVAGQQGWPFYYFNDHADPLPQPDPHPPALPLPPNSFAEEVPANYHKTIEAMLAWYAKPTTQQEARLLNLARYLHGVSKVLRG